ncbi:ABC transporter permease [Bacillus velezensis]|nr:ABC transporter permease [Bacillus velezensis]
MRYFIKRFIAMIMTVLVITTLTFVMMKVIPGSPFNEERGTNEAVQRNLESYYHLNEPLITQYAIYLKSILTFDFGPSIKKPSDSVNAMLERGFPVSFELGITAIIIAVISGLALGIMAALRRGGFLDYAAMSLAVLGISIPNFIMATLADSAICGSSEMVSPAATWTSPVHMVLPTVALAVGPMAIIARLTRSSMAEVLTQDYIRTAKAKGLSPVKIVIKHALKNALMPVVTVLGTLAASILTGSFVIEKIFAIPGMGKYFVESINQRDYPVIMGTTVFYSVILIVLLFLVDLAYGLLDPRIKLHKKG